MRYLAPVTLFSIPADTAMTPFHLCFSSRCAILLYAPLNLKLKTGCRSSRLSRTRHSSRLLRFSACVSGVSSVTS